MALVWFLVFGALVLLLGSLALMFYLYFWGGSGLEVCLMRDLVADFPRQRAELNELRELILTLSRRTPIRGIREMIPEPIRNSVPYVYVIVGERERATIRLDLAIRTRFADQRADLLRMERLMASLGLGAANVSDGDFFMAWRPLQCGYIHVGARSENTYPSRHGHRRIPGEEKWFAFVD